MRASDRALAEECRERTLAEECRERTHSDSLADEYHELQELRERVKRAEAAAAEVAGHKKTAGAADGLFVDMSLGLMRSTLP